MKRPIEPDLRRMPGGAVQILFYVHRGPIKQRNGRITVGFREDDVSRTKKGFEERE